MTIVTFSHLRWDFVYQRPQHVLSRLANQRPVIFIEEPAIEDHHSPEPYWERSRPEKNVTVLRPHTPSAARGYHDEQIPHLQKLVKNFVREERLNDYIAWFYTPMALPLLDGLMPQAIVYDCMDQLSAFLNAPENLLQREAQLLHLADMVFTGGPSLYRSKKGLHPNVYCFPSSVDAHHFAKAKTIQAPAEENTRPRLGYYGVIDERIDLNLLNHLAVSHPEWDIEMVGPVVKIEESTLPRHPNLHYPGQKQYAELPAYLARWDVCLLPFALNKSTEYISPTKTLEYMAAEKMMVSTPITDVAQPYGKIAWIADSPKAFATACEEAMNVSEEERARRVQAMRGVLVQTSWDKTAEAMRDIITRTLDRKNKRTSHLPVSTPVLVVGAGPTGLSAAYHLGENSLLVEQNDRVGGWCRSVQHGGFTFDFAGHIMFSNDPYVHQLYGMLLGDNVHWQDREAWIYSKNVYTRYPFQGSLYGLPPKVIAECIIGAVEARYGALKPEVKPATMAAGRPNFENFCKTGEVKDCCGDGILESTAALGQPSQSGEPRNFEDFIYKIWGAGIAKHFAIPYNRKLWSVPLTEMETSWLGGRVPMPDLRELIEGALSPAPKPLGPNARFGYPLRGGFQALMNGFLPYLRGKVRLSKRLAGLSVRRHVAQFDDGSQVHYDNLISTMPLPALVRMIGEEAPAAIRADAANLRYVSVRCVNLGVGRENITEKHWIYYPEDTVFHRIFVQGNASPFCNPPGGFGLTCEITYSPYKPLPCDGDDLVARCIEDCRKVGIIREDDPVWTSSQVDLPCAYVVYDHGRKAWVDRIREWLSQYGIILAGRYSEWEYYNSDHAFIAGKKAADAVLERYRTRTMSRLQPSQLLESSVGGD
jgi:UDP-galactopyranose mutase